MKIAVIANCQAAGIANVLSVLFPSSQLRSFHAYKNLFKNGEPVIDLKDYDLVFMNKFEEDHWDYLSVDICQNLDNVIFIPPLFFAGSNPDCIYLPVDDVTIGSLLNTYHSFIAVNAWVCGLSVEQCLRLYTPKFYELLDWRNYYERAANWLKALINSYGYDGDVLLEKWRGEGNFMHTNNHPKLSVLVDLVEHICQKKGLKSDFFGCVLDFIPDQLMNIVIFPVYAGLQGSKGVEHQIIYKRSNASVINGEPGNLIINLETFVRDSFARYENFDKGTLACAMPINRVKGFKKALYNYQHSEDTIYFPHPYKSLPDHHYWSKSIEKIAPEFVDPVVAFKFKINQKSKVATAGSCFAQHIAKKLANAGMNYYIAEKGPEQFNDDVRMALGYGVFSARYGNVYTARQLLQLFDRAFGFFSPSEAFWETKDGKYLDPYRPNIGEPFESKQQLLADREIHLLKVREMFSNLDVFVFTLGLTEAWQNVSDGAVYPVAPGVLTHNQDRGQYQFVNFEYDQILDDMHRFILKLKAINPQCQLILTVSPVPMKASLEPRHVLSSNTLSKSVLRAVADKLCNTYSFAAYFPSYEIITGNFNQGRYFAKDLRSVLDPGVSHVMHLFMKHCTTSASTGELSQIDGTELNDDEFEQLSAVVCDEDLIDKD